MSLHGSSRYTLEEGKSVEEQLRKQIANIQRRVMGAASSRGASSSGASSSGASSRGAAKAKRPTRNNRGKGGGSGLRKAAPAGGAGGTRTNRKNNNNNNNNNNRNRGKAPSARNLALVRGGNNEAHVSSNVEGAAAPAAAPPIAMLGARHRISRGDLEYTYLVGINLDSNYEEVLQTAYTAFDPMLSNVQKVEIASVNGEGVLTILGQLEPGQIIRSVPGAASSINVFVYIEDTE